MEQNYAGFGRRLAAALIDGLVINIIIAFLGFLVVLLFGQSAITLVYGVQILTSVGYFVVYQGQAGQTLGKKAMGIKVVDTNGNKPSMMVFFLREPIGKFVSGLILGIGYLMVLWDGKKQGLHDKIAGTYVVKVTPTATVPKAPNV